MLLKEELRARQKWWEDREEDISSYWTTLRKKDDTGIEKGSTRLHSVENSPWQKICERHTTHYKMIQFCLHFDSESLIFHTSNFIPTSAPSFPCNNTAFMRIHYQIHTTKPLELHSAQNLNTNSMTMVKLQTFTVYHPQPLPLTSVRLLIQWKVFSIKAAIIIAINF